MPGSWPEEKRLERIEKVVSLTKMGFSAREISLMVGVTARQVSRDRKRAKIQKPASVPLSEEEIEVAREMLHDGCSYTEAGRTIGRNYKALQRAVPGYGWDRSRGGKYARMLSALNKLSE